MTVNILSAVFTVAYLGCTVYLCRKFRFSPRGLCIGALAIAMTLIMASIMIPLPTGSAITCGSWIPLMLIALVYDCRLAMVSGWLCGILAIVVIPGWAPVHWAQFFLEHLIAFSALGYAGIFGYEKRSRIFLGIGLAVSLRFIAQVLSGVIFFSQNAPSGWGAWAYSLSYHISCKVPETIVTSAVLLALPLKRLSAAARGGKENGLCKQLY